MAVNGNIAFNGWAYFHLRTPSNTGTHSIQVGRPSEAHRERPQCSVSDSATHTHAHTHTHMQAHLAAFESYVDGDLWLYAR